MMNKFVAAKIRIIVVLEERDMLTYLIADFVLFKEYLVIH